MALAVLFSIMIYRLLVGDGPTLAVTFALFGCFLLATKTQHETALPFRAAFCILAGLHAPRRFTRILWFTAPALLVGTSAWLVLNTPEDYRSAPAFTVVFYKLAVLSPDPKSVLADFHMPEAEFGKYIGHYAYESGVPIDDPAFRRRLVRLVNPSSLASFYWRHPAIVSKVLLSDLRDWAPDIALHYSGYENLREPDVRSGKHPFELTLWSGARHRLFTVAPYHLIWLFGAVIVLAPFLRFPLWQVTLLSTLLAISSFLFASLLDAVETARHLVFFQAATDLTIFSIALSVLLSLGGTGGFACLSVIAGLLKRKTSSS
jgi:hypothetical protein